MSEYHLEACFFLLAYLYEQIQFLLNEFLLVGTNSFTQLPCHPRNIVACWLLSDSTVFASTVYDVTRRDTFTNLSDIWAKEIDLYSTNQDCIKMLVGNKVDKVPLLLLGRELPSLQPQSYTLYWSGAFVSLSRNWRYVMMLMNIHICMNLFAGEWQGCQQKRGNWFC